MKSWYDDTFLVILAIASLAVLVWVQHAAAETLDADGAMDAEERLDLLFEEAELWIEECGPQLLSDPGGLPVRGVEEPKAHDKPALADDDGAWGSGACSSGDLEDLPIDPGAMEAIRKFLDEYRPIQHTGVARCLGIADTVPYDDADGDEGEPFIFAADVELTDERGTTGGATIEIAYALYDSADGEYCVVFDIEEFDWPAGK